MATAVRIRPAIHVLGVGGFGEAVVDQLSVGEPVSGPLWPPQSWPIAHVRVFASWRPVPCLTSAFDEVSFRLGTPWLPIIQEHPIVRIGPAVVPGLSPCYSCAQQRFLQHDVDAGMTRALHQFYDGHSEAGPLGFLPPIATFIAITANFALESMLNDPQTEAGRVREFNVLTLGSAVGRVTGLDGCPRCGSVRQTVSEELDKLATTLRIVLEGM
jgi:bacteriocin biosynthesis cyclodehydratase domain-containing protein